MSKVPKPIGCCSTHTDTYDTTNNSTAKTRCCSLNQLNFAGEPATNERYDTEMQTGQRYEDNSKQFRTQNKTKRHKLEVAIFSLSHMINRKRTHQSRFGSYHFFFEKIFFKIQGLIHGLFPLGEQDTLGTRCKSTLIKHLFCSVAGIQRNVPEAAFISDSFLRLSLEAQCCLENCYGIGRVQKL